MTVKLELTEDEALVLFEWLSREKPAEVVALIGDQAEQRVLWNVEASLEKQLTTTFSPDYTAALEQARAKLRDG